MQLAPQVQYTPPGGSLTTLALTTPHDPPNLQVVTIGGSRTSVGLVTAAYRKALYHVATYPLRVLEAELPDVVTWLLDAQYGRPFSWWFDASDNATRYDNCVLVAPAMGERMDWPRSADYPEALELATFAIRRPAGLMFDVRLNIGA